MKAETLILMFGFVALMGVGVWYVSRQPGKGSPPMQAPVAQNPIQAVAQPAPVPAGSNAAPGANAWSFAGQAVTTAGNVFKTIFSDS